MATTPTPFSPLQSFPHTAGVLRILAIDSDPVSLKILHTLLLACSYQVTTCTRALDALSILGSSMEFDLVMTAVHLPDINGLQLLGHLVNLGIRLPVILFTEDEDNFTITRGLSLGAFLVLAKPFRMEVLMLLWQLLFPRTASQFCPSDAPQLVAPAEKIRKKKKRFVWSSERHCLFVAAIESLGHKDAVPKKILEYMQARCPDPDLDRHVISSHLQKFRESTTGAEQPIQETISPISELFQGSGELDDIDYLLEELLQTDSTTCLDEMFQ